MPEPKRHHYLPEFYLRRWAKDGKVWRFLRPNGPRSVVHAKFVAPKSAGFKTELYSYPNPVDPAHAQTIERDFLQIIDSKGSAALAKAEKNEPATLNDKAALSQFLLSMMHRSPARIEHLAVELAKRVQESDDEMPADFIRHHTLSLFSDLIASESMIEGLTKMSTYIVAMGPHRHFLMTSDCPIMISNGLYHRNSFVMLPIGPSKLLVLANRPEIPEAFANQETGKLVLALNDAVVTQAKDLVIGTRKSERRFVENRLNRNTGQNVRHRGEIDGLIRWDPPL